MKKISIKRFNKRNNFITSRNNFVPLLSGISKTHYSGLIFPGARDASFTETMEFREHHPKFPIYRITDTESNVLNQKDFDESLELIGGNEEILKLYRQMVFMANMDDVLYSAQRQGRISFYMTNWGEEAIQFGTAHALNNEDTVFAQYREAGVLFYRGFTLDQALHQCLSTKKDIGKGRQMPIHYGHPDFHFQTISSPLSTQIPQASGAGYALKQEGSDKIVACYFGEGAASEGDFHAALNFAATLSSHTMFVCRNNGYAISTPTEDQYRGDGIAARGPAYGIPTIRVDGNDIFAVYLATHRARELILKESKPVLIEFMAYRVGHHSTSDDSTRYRDESEIKKWKNELNPITRLKHYVQSENLWTEKEDEEYEETVRDQIIKRLGELEKEEKVSPEDLIEDVYDDVPEILQEQAAFIKQITQKYPEFYKKSH